MNHLFFNFPLSDTPKLHSTKYYQYTCTYKNYINYRSPFFSMVLPQTFHLQEECSQIREEIS